MLNVKQHYCWSYMGRQCWTRANVRFYKQVIFYMLYVLVQPDPMITRFPTMTLWEAALLWSPKARKYSTSVSCLISRSLKHYSCNSHKTRHQYDAILCLLEIMCRLLEILYFLMTRTWNNVVKCYSSFELGTDWLKMLGT